MPYDYVTTEPRYHIFITDKCKLVKPTKPHPLYTHRVTLFREDGYGTYQEAIDAIENIDTVETYFILPSIERSYEEIK